MSSSSSSSSLNTNSIHLCGTWPFCAKPLEEQLSSSSAKKSSSSSSLLSEIIINAIEAVELNPNQPTVGAPGSVPNSDGIFELDAAWMRSSCSLMKENNDQREEGKDDNDDDVDGECGAVYSLRGFNGAIRVAHQVALTCPHAILAGEGARMFAEKWVATTTNCSELQDRLLMKKTTTTMLTEEKGTPKTVNDEQKDRHQDTLGVVGIHHYHDRKEDETSSGKIEIIAAVSSSGLGKKHPGRIGDSPLYGSGLYCDGRIGAVTATGDGDVVSLFPISFVAVQEMKRLSSSIRNKNNSKIDFNIVDRACAFAIEQFFDSPNVRAFCKRSEIKNRLSEGGPLIGLCGACFYRSGGSSEDPGDGELTIIQTGGACCENWRYEFKTSHLIRSSSDVDTEGKEATIRSY